MAMERVNQPMSFLFCKCCLGRYNTVKIPKILPACGHTICKDCIQAKDERTINECPECKKIFMLPESGNTEEFPTNYDLLSAIHEMSNEDDTNENNDKEEPEQVQMENTNQCIPHGMPSEFFCDTCSEETCNNCLLDNHNPRTHKITTKTDYLQVKAKEVQKLAEQLSSLLSSQSNLNKQLTDADTKCQQEAKQLKEQIMDDLEMKIREEREEAHQMIREVSANTQSTRKRLKEILEDLNWLIFKIKEQQQSNTAMERAISNKCVPNLNTLKEIRMKTDKILKQADKLQKSNSSLQTGLNLTFQKKKHQARYLRLQRTNAGLFTLEKLPTWILIFITLSVVFLTWFWSRRDQKQLHHTLKVMYIVFLNLLSGIPW